MISFTACSMFAVQETSEQADQIQALYTMHDLTVTELFEGPFTMGELANSQIDEASGLAYSIRNPGHLWTHNDSGDFNRIFLIGKDGSDAGTFRILGTGNRDWEDMSIGAGPIDGIPYLYIADIGDNRAQYDIKRIFRFPEPKADDYDTSLNLINVPSDSVDTILFRYPDDVQKDAETLMIDPLTRDLYVVTKREFPVTVYIARYPYPLDELFYLERLGGLPVTDITAGDISPDGRRILLKTKERVFMWSRNEGESIASALSRPPVRLPYVPEPQGEAITWDSVQEGYYVLSESRSVTPVLYYYRMLLQ
ncbi:MAG: hypothetical protein JJU41_03290 [Bacteroidetes bacterium]|nr:hypothetical protein [Bacteroidota bacterium]